MEIENTEIGQVKKAKRKKRVGIPESAKHFDDLPNAAFVRQPTVEVLYGCSASTVWRGVKSKRIPAPHKLSSGVTAWNVGELRLAQSRE